jgi:RNA polymerase sigma-70 factor (ECF subfamily)
MPDKVSPSLNPLDQYEIVYKTYFKPLHYYAVTLVQDSETAEEMVQNVFLKLWEKRESLEIQSSLQAYLYKSVYFESLNHLKREKIKLNYVKHKTWAMEQEDKVHSTASLNHKELQQRFREALRDLPEQCRTVFQLSRFEELKYREIASYLGISEKTVENHMGKALRVLRGKLVDFLVLALVSIFHLKQGGL